MAFVFSSIAKLTVGVLATVGASSVYAWQNCVPICDIQCMGVEFAKGSIGHVEDLASIEAAIMRIAETSLGTSEVEGSTLKAVSNYGKDISQSFSDSADAIEDLEIIDKPLQESESSRTVTAINGITVKFSELTAKRNRVQELNVAAFMNEITTAVDVVEKLTKAAYLDAEIASDIADNAALSAQRIHQYHQIKNSNVTNIYRQSEMYKSSIDSKQSVSALVRKKKEEGINAVAKLLFAPREIEKEDWKHFGQLDNSLTATHLVNYFHDITSGEYQEFSDKDFQKAVFGKLIDLQGMQLLKQNEYNLLSYETMNSRYMTFKEK